MDGGLIEGGDAALLRGGKRLPEGEQMEPGRMRKKEGLG